MAAFKGDSIFWIETSKIVPNPYQPRREFDEERLKELADSIRMYGVLQPLTVSRKEVHGEDGAFKTEYELIAGERRLRASTLAGVEQVPVIIREGDDSEQEKLELAIIENLQREDLNAVDRALAFKQLADMFDLSHGQVAAKVGRSREYVSNSIRILNLPEYMLESVKTADISEGHARTLLMLNDRPEEQDTLYREILMKKLTVREVERIARKIAVDKVRKQKWKGTDPELIEKEKQFTETLGTRVQLTKTDYGGKITIDYFSDEDLDLLLRNLAHRAEAEGIQSPTVSAVTSAAAAVGSSQAAIDALSQATPLEPVSDDTVATPEPAASPDVRAATSTDTPAANPPAASEATPETVTPKPEPTDTTPTSEPAPERSSLRDKLAQFFHEPAATPEPQPQPEPPATPSSPSDTIPASNTNTEPKEVPAPVVTDEAVPPTNQKPADDTPEDLYGIKNFNV